MLKIKENLNLKELEKFIGYKIYVDGLTNSTYTITGITHNDYANDKKFEKLEGYVCKNDICFELDNGDDFINIELAGNNKYNTKANCFVEEEKVYKELTNLVDLV